MSGVSANCYGTKWHRRRGSNRNDVDDQKSRQSKPSFRANVRASDRVFGLCFVFARGSYARPPVSVAVPGKQGECSHHEICKMRFTHVILFLSANEDCKRL